MTTPDSIFKKLQALSSGDPRWIITFPVKLPDNTTADELQAWLSASGFSRVHAQPGKAKDEVLDVVADQISLANAPSLRA
jgi:excinuclease ABC subunit A